METKVVTIRKSGKVDFIYDDKLKGLLKEGPSSIKRASHVEPDIDNTWYADLSPVGGPLLKGFETREAALQAEKEWIEKNVLSR